ncbi:MAG: YncE family protein [Flavobacteriales bacterium]|nr:YncE family protein [Flavobacteriales bacterium]
MSFKLFITSTFSILLFISCKRETIIPPQVITVVPYETFVVNEGSFLGNNASVTHISKDGVLTEDPYFDANGFPLGDVLQSFTAYNDRGYAVLNNSAKVEVFNLQTFVHEATITGCDYPRYFLPVSSTKAYLTNGSLGGEVDIIDLGSNTITGTIVVGNGPEGLASFGTKVFVCNGGGWSFDNTVSVIDAGTDTVIETIDVGDRPQQAVVDKEGNLWVLCSGEILYDINFIVMGHTPAMMYKIDAVTFDVLTTAQIGAEGDHPIRLAVSGDGDFVYYENNGVYRVDVVGGDLAGSLLISGAHYGMGVHSESGDIWTADPSDFTNNSVIRRHDALGVQLEEIQAGIGASGFVFN